MILGLHLEVFLALVYAAFLMGLAFLLEFLARHSHRRSENYRSSGFIYFRDLDYWECPAGRQLVQLSTDHRRGVTSYRAPASDCNRCSLKVNCTDSDSGRVLERRLDGWIESELRRFHRGISLVLAVLATLILLAETFRYPAPGDRAVLVALITAIVAAEWRLLPSLLTGRPHL